MNSVAFDCASITPRTLGHRFGRPFQRSKLFGEVTYAPEFRRQMVELVRAGRTPEKLAKEFLMTEVKSLGRAFLHPCEGRADGFF